MSRVVITGASSFVGCHLVRAFAKAGWQVAATHSQARADYSGIRAERLAHAAGAAELRRLDLCDTAAVTHFAADIAPELWLHHAGYATDYASPGYDVAQGHALNVAPLAALYAALAGRNCTVIVTGSSTEYATSNCGNRENDMCVPETPYGKSKLAETMAAQALAQRHGVPTRVARLYIPFGPLDSPGKLIPTVSEALRTGRAVDLSPCEQKRDFLAVEEVCRGYLALADDMRRTLFDIFNLCSGKALALKSLLLSMAKAAGRDPSLLRFGAIAMRPGEPPVSFGENAKAAAMLGWRPLAPETTLAELVAAP
jgi:nucleoside-diphosphate-sugar epimerase